MCKKHPSSLSDLLQNRNTLITKAWRIAPRAASAVHYMVPLPLVRAYSGAHREVCTVRSFLLLQHTVKTKSTDTGIRSHGPSVCVSWKVKMPGRIQLTFFQLSEQQACKLSFVWPHSGSKELEAWLHSASFHPEPDVCKWGTVLSRPSALAACCDSGVNPSHGPASKQCKSHLWDWVQSVLLLIPAAFVKVTFLDRHFWLLYYHPCRTTPWMERMNCPLKRSCLSHLSGNWA